MADPRAPRFELHIRPMMRLLDREHMRPFGFDLWSYDDVRAHAEAIIGFARDGLMPPASHGGPWPQEWIDLFVRWRDTGFQRLGLATAAAGGITAARSGSVITLTAKGRVPSAGVTVWLDLEEATTDRRAYRLTQEPPVNPVPAERPFTARERIDTGGANLSVSVTDADGAHEVPITGGEFVHLVGPFERVVRELAGAGFEVPPTAAAGAPATITLGDHALRVLGDDMFAEVTGTPEALELFRQRVPRARR